jgi:hypothetical protein
MTTYMTFGRWLLHQTRRDDVIGELARHAEEDIAMPINAKGKERWYVYLERSGRRAELEDGLHLGWAEWERGEGYPSGEGPRPTTWCICHLDREYARAQGDPDLAVVEAADQREALEKASKLGLCAPSGLWAYQRRN